jgi:eukaryotic-like serine/threonine-protein kinase
VETNDPGGFDAAHPEHPQPEQLVGTTFADRYRLTRLLSIGANTVIYDADDIAARRPVTVKVVQPELAGSDDFQSRFDSTIRSVAALSHPNIAAIFDWGQAEFAGAPTAYVAIEQLRAGSLRDLYDRGRRLSPSQALSVGLDACRALDHAHRRGFVHGELTPSKLVFGDDRRLRIVDFGLAALLSETAWAEPATVSTHVARYASPEQALSLPIAGTTDVYALCLTLVEGVTGQLPFAADSTVATLAARVGKLMPVSADLGPLAAVLERAGRPHAEERSTAAQFGQSLVQTAEKLPRPEPLPLLSSSLFDTPVDELRSPDDPTGGVKRPRVSTADEVEELVLVTIDEPDSPVDADDDADGDDADGDDADGDDADGDDADGDDADGDDAINAAGDHDSADLDDEAATAATTSAVAPLDPLLAASGAGATESGGAGAIDPGGAGAIDPGGVGAAEPGGADAHQRAADEPAAAAHAAASTQPGVATGIGPNDIEQQSASDPVDDEADVTLVAPVTPVAAQVDEPTGRGGRLGRVLLALVLLAALVGLAVVAVRLFSTPSYDVPELGGAEESVALASIEEFNWDVTIEYARSDDEPRPGRVVRTVPSAGERLARGEPFLLVVSEGPEFRTLPDLSGLSFVDAEARLVALALEPTVVEAFDEDVPRGGVVSWTVPGQPELVAGDQVLPETEVIIVASLGPAPRTVPDLTGLTGAAARSTLDDLRLEMDEAEQVFDDVVPLGQIVSQSPEAGDEVERGATITITLSRGPDLVLLPELEGLTFAEAQTVLAEAGFTTRLVLGASDGEFASATIDGEPAEPGAPYRRGSQVDVVFI